MNEKYNKILKKAFPGLRDVVGIDLGASAVKAVRLKADSFGKITVMSAASLPAYDKNTATGPIQLPKDLCAWSAAFAIPSRKGLVKLIAQSSQIKDDDLPELLGLPKVNDYRIGAMKLGDGKQTPLLVAGIPKTDVENIAAILPPGKPLPASAELSGLASLSSYLHAYKNEYGEGCDLIIDAGRKSMTMGVFTQGLPCVIRQFETGSETLEQAVADAFSCDAATVRDIILSGEVDIGSVIQSAFSNLLRQTGIAVDFTERRTSSRLSRIFLTGGLAGNKGFTSEIKNSFGLEPETLNPWRKLQLQANAISDSDKNSGYSFAAATAAAISVLEEN